MCAKPRAMSLPVGTPAPLFFAPSPVTASSEFIAAGGRYVLLAFLPEPSAERDAALAAIGAASGLFRDDNALAFGVLPDATSLAAATNTATTAMTAAAVPAQGVPIPGPSSRPGRRRRSRRCTGFCC